MGVLQFILVQIIILALVVSVGAFLVFTLKNRLNATRDVKNVEENKPWSTEELAKGLSVVSYWKNDKPEQNDFEYDENDDMRILTWFYNGFSFLMIIGLVVVGGLTLVTPVVLIVVYAVFKRKNNLSLLYPFVVGGTWALIPVGIGVSLYSVYKTVFIYGVDWSVESTYLTVILPILYTVVSVLACKVILLKGNEEREQGASNTKTV